MADRTRRFRLPLALGVAFLIGSVTVSCGDSSGGSGGSSESVAGSETTSTATPDVSTSESSSTSAAPSPSDTTSSSPPADLPTIEELWAFAEETVALPRMSFELDVTSTLPGTDAPVLARRTGSFDDDSFSGVGTRSFETSEAQLRELWGDEPFEFRFIGETFWMYNPLSDPPGWGGFDVVEFAEFAGGDPLGSVDGDAYLGLLVSATVEVLDVEQQADGSMNWLLRVRADDLVPMVAAGGPASRLIGLGAADSGLEVSVELVQAPEGYFSGFRFDMSEWWANALSLAGPSEGDESMTVEFRLDPFDVPLSLEAPCESPATRIDDDGLTVLVCG